MMISFLRKKGKAPIYENIPDLFDQKKISGRARYRGRNFRRQSEGFIFAGMHHAYRHMKCNFDYLSGK